MWKNLNLLMTTRTSQSLKKSNSELSTREKGNLGEDRAVNFLLSQKYEILDRNYRIRTGEIDIVALKDDTVVFVEVKSLPHGNLEILSHELNSTKQKRLLKLLNLTSKIIDNIVTGSSDMMFLPLMFRGWIRCTTLSMLFRSKMNAVKECTS